MGNTYETNEKKNEPYLDCKEKCNNCGRSQCFNNINLHKQIFELGKQFENKVNDIPNYLSKKLNEISDDLKNNYNIIHGCTGCTESNHFIEEVTLQKDIIVNNIKKKNNNLSNLYKNEVKNLEKEHYYILNEFRNDFNIKKKNYIKKENPKIKDLEIEKQNVEEIKTKKKMEYTQDKKDDIINEYMKEENIKYENNLKEEKKLIDNEYSFNIEDIKFEYTENEKDTINLYKNQINQIQNYSKIIPNYNDIINNFKLNVYFNC